MSDYIFIANLELFTHIGITPEEREQPQRLTVSLMLQPRKGFADLGDNIANAVDYATVCTRVRELAAGAARNLIETLTEEIAATLLREFPLDAVEIELRKYILPETDYVAVKIRREPAL
jgi:dihydroneopterin aldolase